MTTIAELADQPRKLTFSSADPRFTSIEITHYEQFDRIIPIIEGVNSTQGDRRTTLGTLSAPSYEIAEIQAYCKMLEQSQTCAIEPVNKWIIYDEDSEYMLLVEQLTPPEIVLVRVYSRSMFVESHIVNLFNSPDAHDPVVNNPVVKSVSDFTYWLRCRANVRNHEAMIRWLHYAIVAHYRMTHIVGRLSAKKYSTVVSVGLYVNVDKTYGKNIDTTLRVEFGAIDYTLAMIEDFSHGDMCGVILMRPKNSTLPPVIYGKFEGLGTDLYRTDVVAVREKTALIKDSYEQSVQSAQSAQSAQLAQLAQSAPTTPTAISVMLDKPRMEYLVKRLRDLSGENSAENSNA